MSVKGTTRLALRERGQRPFGHAQNADPGDRETALNNVAPCWLVHDCRPLKAEILARIRPKTPESARIHPLSATKQDKILHLAEL